MMNTALASLLSNHNLETSDILEALITSCNQDVSEFEHMHNALEQSKQQINALQDQISQLQAKNLQLLIERDRYHEKVLELQNINEPPAPSNDTLEQYKKQLAEFKTIAPTAKKVRAKIKELKDRNQTLHTKANHSQMQLLQLKQKLIQPNALDDAIWRDNHTYECIYRLKEQVIFSLQGQAKAYTGFIYLDGKGNGKVICFEANGLINVPMAHGSIDTISDKAEHFMTDYFKTYQHLLVLGELL